MRRMSHLVVALATVAVVGCETTERVLPSGQNVRHVNDSEDEPKTPATEQRLLTETEENPSSRAWWELGEYYENAQRFPEALNAYTQMQALIETDPQTRGRKFTAGDYHLGRLYTKVRDYLRAIHHLKAVVALQPQDPTEASLNRHFREAHYLLGGIYFENKQWDPAKKHFVTFRELGGEAERVEPWLAKIDEIQWAGEARAGRGRRPSGQTPTPAGTPVPATPPGGQ
jgi:tetratricopeptide (TPR) repeat protein